MLKPTRKVTPVFWVGRTLSELKAMPDEVQDDIGHALYDAQCGDMPSVVKPLSGFGDAGILEIVESHDGNAYRAVYTVRFQGRIYVLHVFQKKSKRGIATPKLDVELVRSRLKRAEEIHREWTKAKRGASS